jgi:hypothetical protein
MTSAQRAENDRIDGELAAQRARYARLKERRARAQKAKLATWWRAWNQDFERQQRARKHQEFMAEIDAKHTEFRRREEALERRDRLAAFDRYRQLPPRADGKGNAPRWLLEWKQRDANERAGVTSHRELVARGRAQVLAICREQGIRAEFCATPAINAYAFPTVNRVECAPIVTLESYASALHEVGHVLNQPPASAPRVRTTDGRRSVCVDGELLAWRWAVLHALDWTREMQAWLGDCLNTYRRYATPDQAVQIDALSSPRAYYHEWVRRWR